MNDFIKKVLNQFADNITDRVFLMIQNDPELMQDYLKLLENRGVNGGSTLKTLNSEIGEAIKIKFNLGNIKICPNPKSTLIRNSYTRHKIN